VVERVVHAPVSTVLRASVRGYAAGAGRRPAPAAVVATGRLVDVDGRGTSVGRRRLRANP